MKKKQMIALGLAAAMLAGGLSGVRPAAHVSNRCKSGIRPVVGRI